MNMIANILGLGNAATPLGIKAMKSMQKINLNKETLSNSMVMLIVLNTASIQIIPTTVIAIRASLNSKNPTGIIFPVWIVTICAAVAGVVVTKILILYENKKLDSSATLTPLMYISAVFVEFSITSPYAFFPRKSKKQRFCFFYIIYITS